MQGETKLIIIRPDLHEPIGPPKPPWFQPGDWFAAVAKPVARFLDKWFRTQYVGCGACGQRQAAMNRWPARIIVWFKKAFNGALTFYV